MDRGTVVAAALGECVHVAGVLSFLRLAEQAGWHTVFLGPAVPIDRVIEVARKAGAQLVGISYRLTPETGERLLADFAEQADDLRMQGVRFVFGGTPPVAEKARGFNGFFEAIFDGSQPLEMISAYLRGEALTQEPAMYPQSLLERIEWKAPYPLLRHHFGLPTMDATRDGIEKIADAGVLDVISLGVDQDAQANFFHPERQDIRRFGAGGVPVRSAEDYASLYAASRRGNAPLMRAYSGTDDLIALAEMYVRTIHIAWAAVPLFWFNAMDGRGPHDLERSISEHQALMAWYADRNIPVEVNEPHHWGMRDAPDVIFVVAAYLSAFNARHVGVKDYVMQMMFNSPPGTSDAMDLAKMLACIDLVAPLQCPTFRVWRQTRVGLLSHPLDPEEARGHLAAATYLQMALRPHILHVVGHTEAHHAATADDVISACKVARRAAANAVQGMPDPLFDPVVQERKKELLAQASVTLEAIRSLAGPDVASPMTDAKTLTDAVRQGILDAPHLKSNPFARGQIVSRMDGRGACIAADPSTGKWQSERQRIQHLRLPSLRGHTGVGR